MSLPIKKPGFVAPADRWFHDNTREPIRDETLRDGLVRIGAVVTRSGLATTSSKGRYALRRAKNLFASPSNFEASNHLIRQCRIEQRREPSLHRPGGGRLDPTFFAASFCRLTF
jgi:hypothetical protein